MVFKDKNVMVVGMAKSGFSAAKLLVQEGANVLLYDRRDSEQVDLGELADSCTDCLGKDPMEIMEQSDILVLSPGVPTRLDFIKKAHELKKPVISEIELGYLFSKADFVCISGTNGKTTTTALTGEIFKNAGRKTYVLGNIGRPITEDALKTKPGDTVVAEVAALQLETIDTFRPRAAALLNVTEDHMDRFLTMDYYTHCKMRMFENQTADDFAVLNLDNEITAKMGEGLKGKVLSFSRVQKVENGAYVNKGELLFVRDGEEEFVCNKDDIVIPGAHNLENALAATCLAMSMGIDARTVEYTLKTFAGVEHRIEFVKTVDGISYINDSKGTNPDATIKAIEAMTKPTVLILGGFDKHSEFDDMFAHFTDNIKGIVLLGATRDKINEAAEKAGFANKLFADTFEEAVMKAKGMAERGYNVLLSPACASWDMFDNFEQRGEVFKEIVNSL